MILFFASDLLVGWFFFIGEFGVMVSQGSPGSWFSGRSWLALSGFSGLSGLSGLFGLSWPFSRSLGPDLFPGLSVCMCDQGLTSN
jgi:hypothetical protein